MTDWVKVCALDDIDEEDVIPFDHNGQAYAIYRSPEDEVFATSGICTHEKAYLAEGLVMDDIIECPKHNGCFDYKTGEAKRAPCRTPLKTFPAKVEGGTVYIQLD